MTSVLYFTFIFLCSIIILTSVCAIKHLPDKTAIKVTKMSALFQHVAGLGINASSTTSLQLHSYAKWNTEYLKTQALSIITIFLCSLSYVNYSCFHVYEYVNLISMLRMKYNDSLK